MSNYMDRGCYLPTQRTAQGTWDLGQLEEFSLRPEKFEIHAMKTQFNGVTELAIEHSCRNASTNFLVVKNN